MNDAQRLFHKAKELANKKPDKLITDGLRSNHDAFNKEFYTNTTPKLCKVKIFSPCYNNMQIDLTIFVRASACNFSFYMENNRQNIQFYPLCTALSFL